MLYEESVRKRSNNERLFISLIASKRHQRHISGEFDGVSNKSLVGITEFIPSGRPYLKLRCDKFPQKRSVLIINSVYIVFTKYTFHRV